jgi:hypothetical protein
MEKKLVTIFVFILQDLYILFTLNWPIGLNGIASYQMSGEEVNKKPRNSVYKLVDGSL